MNLEHMIETPDRIRLRGLGVSLDTAPSERKAAIAAKVRAAYAPIPRYTQPMEEGIWNQKVDLALKDSVISGLREENRRLLTTINVNQNFTFSQKLKWFSFGAYYLGLVLGAAYGLYVLFS